jgi:UDP-N-acetylglucosamine transferase subunit ALG13
MILATVGTQLPFPRLLTALDDIAGRHGLRVFAQTADAHLKLIHIDYRDHLTPSEFRERSALASLLVGHAGIGTVLTARKLQKPLVIFPRRADLGEHRNDHQLATAKALQNVEGIYVAWTETDLEALLTLEDLKPASLGFSQRREDLIQHLRSFVQTLS